MRTQAPPLLPILRSRTQADVLTHLFMHPGQGFTQRDLSRELGVAPSTIHQEVSRLVEAGILNEQTVGRSRLLTVNQTNRLTTSLGTLILEAFGPRVVVAEEFADLPGVLLVIIYGSWASRYEGVRGAQPADVDVLVVGSVDRDEVYAAANRAQERLGIEVNPTVRTARTLKSGDDPLSESIKQSPYLVVWESGAAES